MTWTVPVAAALLASLAFAGAASASDYMLPLLLERTVQPPDPSTPPGAEPQAAGPAIAPANPAIVGGALLGAALVVAATMYFVVRNGSGRAG